MCNSPVVLSVKPNERLCNQQSSFPVISSFCLLAATLKKKSLLCDTIVQRSCRALLTPVWKIKILNPHLQVACTWEHLLTPGGAFFLGEITWFASVTISVNQKSEYHGTTWFIQFQSNLTKFLHLLCFQCALEDSQSSMKRYFFPKRILLGSET